MTNRFNALIKFARTTVCKNTVYYTIKIVKNCCFEIIKQMLTKFFNDAHLKIHTKNSKKSIFNSTCEECKSSSNTEYCFDSSRLTT